MIAVVDYGMGNLRSVANAFEAIGAPVRVTSRPQDLEEAERIVLPGVGAFGEAIGRLREIGMVDAMHKAVVEAKKPFLGICLGMQLLAERSFEHGEHPGLGWIPGCVRRIEPRDPTLRVPHVGWNSVTTRGASGLFRGLPHDPAFYFVHSFWFDVEDSAAVVGTCDYGGQLVAAVCRDHVFGTQFHPEKSHHAGLTLLKNFVAYGT